MPAVYGFYALMNQGCIHHLIFIRPIVFARRNQLAEILFLQFYDLDLVRILLVRIGVFAHLVDATFFVLMALTLYQLLKHVNKSVARSMLVFVALAVGIISLNAVFLFEGLQVATDTSYAAAFGTAGSNALVLLLLDIQHFGTLIAQIFFGLWLAPMGYLAYKSGWFPKALGIVLVSATVSYLVDTFTAFLVPAFEKEMHVFLIIMPIIAEIWLLGYLLLVGVNIVKPAKRIIPATIAMPGAQA